MIKRHERKIRIFFLMVVSFTIGFAVHALFFPYLLTDNVGLMIQKRPAETSLPESGPITSLTKVIYLDGEFSPRVARVKNSYYISIVNESEHRLMFLGSNNALLTTPRGYGRSEEVRAQLYDKGIYEVFDKNNPASRLKVIVE